MTNRIAIWIGVVIVILLLADALLRSGAETIFLGRKLVDVIDWLAFWR